MRPYLITGESGVGKEVMARFLHKKSRRASKPFISVNCAAIPENLLESELFGHEKGAFTGALARRVGKFEEADGGTLIAGRDFRNGRSSSGKAIAGAYKNGRSIASAARKPVKVDIRILATSNRDLIQAVRDGDFREDLLYRLNVMNLRIPPLRERRSDIAALSDFFVNKYCSANGLPAKKLSDDARGQIEAAQWPGNVRELENAMHRAVILSRSPLIEPTAIRTPDGAPVSAATPCNHEETAQKAVEAASAASLSFSE